MKDKIRVASFRKDKRISGAKLPRNLDDFEMGNSKVIEELKSISRLANASSVRFCCSTFPNGIFSLRYSTIPLASN